MNIPFDCRMGLIGVAHERCLGGTCPQAKEQPSETTKAVYTILRQIATLIPCESMVLNANEADLTAGKIAAWGETIKA